MPFEVFNLLLEKMENAHDALEEHLADGSISPETAEEFNEFYEAFCLARTATVRLATTDEPLTKDNAALTHALYLDFMDKAAAFCRKTSPDIPEVVAQAARETGRMMVVVRSHARGLESAANAEDGAEPVTMQDIQSDFTWVADVFNDDPNVADKHEIPSREWVNTDHSMQENLEKYRDCVKLVAERFDRHMCAITGSDTPMEAFNDKIDLIQMALNKAWQPGRPLSVGPVKSLMAEVRIMLSGQNLSRLNRAEVINDDWFTVVVGKDPDSPDFYYNRIVNGPIKGKNAEAFKTALKKIFITPENFGIDNETLNTLEESSRDVSVIGNIISSIIEYNLDEDPTLNDDFDHPMYNALKKAKEMNNAIVDFLKAKPGAKLPTEDDAMQLLEAIADGSMKTDMYYMQLNSYYLNGNKTCIKDFSADLLKLYPGMKERFQPVVDRCHAFNKAQADEVCREFIVSDMWADGFIDLAEKASRVMTNDFYDDDTRDKLKFLAICRNTNMRANYLKNLPTQKDLLLARVAEYETNCLTTYYEHGRSLSGRVLHPYSMALANAYESDVVLTPDKLEKVYEYYDELLSSETAQRLMDMHMLDLDELLKNADLGELLYGPDSVMPECFTAETLDVLCRSSRNGFQNSQQYNDIKDAINLMASQAHTFGGVKGDTYRQLYNACTTYMYTHDSNPTTPTGKARFNAAATVMADIYSRVYDKFPDMRQQMERDLEANMIRSRHFREKVAEFNPDLADAASEVETVLHDTLNKTMITGKADTPEKQNALLGKFRTLAQRHGEEIERREHANAPKEAEKGGVFHLS